MPKLDDGADGLLRSGPPGDGDKCTGSSQKPLQCYVYGAWLRGRQTLNEHIRGRRQSLYNYITIASTKYCGLSFKCDYPHF